VRRTRRHGGAVAEPPPGAGTVRPGTPRPGTPRAGTLHAGTLRTGTLAAATPGDSPARDPDAAPVAGGYRLVRLLGEGRHGAVHLGYAGGAGADDEPRIAAVKIHHDAVPPERVDTEIAALTRVAHPHALHLDDLATLPDGRACLIFERVGGRGLGRLVAESDVIGAGEAVTILAPIVDAVHALHAGGVAHGRIRLSNVLFRDSGAPVLVGFGRASLLTSGSSPAALASDPAVLDDRRQLAALVEAVLDRVAGEAAGALSRRIGEADAGADGFTAWLAEQLFDLAPPQPVRFVRGDARPITPRIVNDPPPTAEPASERGRAALLRLLQTVSAVLDRARGVRPRLWFVAGGVVVSLVSAVLVIPTGSAPPTGDGGIADRGAAEGGAADDGGAGAGAGAAPADGGAGDGAAAVDPTPAAGRPAETTPGAAADGTAEAHALVADDPVAALVVLLRERDRCIRDVSVLCLDGVLQAGSVAMQRDADLVRSVQGGGELTADAAIVAGAPVLIERLGDSALIDLGEVPQTQPASVLVMRSEAGWRIRNYLFR